MAKTTKKAKATKATKASKMEVSVKGTFLITRKGLELVHEVKNCTRCKVVMRNAKGGRTEYIYHERLIENPTREQINQYGGHYK